MKIKWLGQATFLITSVAGTRIITDPFITGGALHYDEIKESADVVTVSHEHRDHNNTDVIGGKPQILRSSAKVKGIEFKAVATYHDNASGQNRGNNTVFCFTIDGVSVCHLGDLGHTLDAKQVAEIDKVDVLLVPVGGHFTIDADMATKVCDQLKPTVIIPMHFKNERCEAPISTVDNFLKGKKNVRQSNASETELKAGELPAVTEIIVLKPAL